MGKADHNLTNIYEQVAINTLKEIRGVAERTWKRLFRVLRSKGGENHGRRFSGQREEEKLEL